MNFMNFELGAMNVLTVDVDEDIVQEFGPMTESTLSEPEFAVVRPQWNSDVSWVSPKNRQGFDVFQSAYDRLGIATHVRQYLDLDSEPRMYTGFLVFRTRCTDTNFHVDWLQTGNQAFTFLTPLTSNASGFGLLYKKVTGTVAEYDYKLGEGIIFGDGFLHSTAPGNSSEPVALLCFNFGTDKMTYWDKIVQTAGYQCQLLRQPDGQLVARSKGSWTPQPAS